MRDTYKRVSEATLLFTVTGTHYLLNDRILCTGLPPRANMAFINLNKKTSFSAEPCADCLEQAMDNYLELAQHQYVLLKRYTGKDSFYDNDFSESDSYEVAGVGPTGVSLNTSTCESASTCKSASTCESE